MAYVLLLIAGALLCNGLPHLVAGVQGRRFPTPWAKPPGVGMSSPLENMLWGSANLAIAALIFDRELRKNVPHGLVAVAIGFVATGCLLAILFGRRAGR